MHGDGARLDGGSMECPCTCQQFAPSLGYCQCWKWLCEKVAQTLLVCVVHAWCEVFSAAMCCVVHPTQVWRTCPNWADM